MKLHGLWLLLALVAWIHSQVVVLGPLASVGAYITICFCILFWYLGEIRACLKAIADKR